MPKRGPDGRGRGRSRGWLPRAALLAAALTVGAASAGCDPHISDGAKVVNGTRETLHFVLLMADGPVSLSTVGPYGGTLLLSPGQMGSDGCSPYAVAAYDAEGREVARHAAGKGLCLGDTWTVGSMDASPSGEPGHTTGSHPPAASAAGTWNRPDTGSSGLSGSGWRVPIVLNPYSRGLPTLPRNWKDRAG